jgi:hypothetical protein
MRSAIKHNVGTIYTTDDRVGEAHWIPPHRPELPLTAQLRSIVPMLRAPRSVSMSALHEFNRFEAQAHPKAPHWYLSGIATDRSRRSSSPRPKPTCPSTRVVGSSSPAKPICTRAGRTCG